MNPIFYIQWSILALIAIVLLWTIVPHFDLFFKMLSGTLVLYILTGIVGTFQNPSVTWVAMKTFAIVYGVGMMIVFCVSVFILNKIDNEKAYLEPYDDEAPTTVYIGEPIVVDGEVVDDVPTPLRGLWKL